MHGLVLFQHLLVVTQFLHDAGQQLSHLVHYGQHAHVIRGTDLVDILQLSPREGGLVLTIPLLTQLGTLAALLLQLLHCYLHVFQMTIEVLLTVFFGTPSLGGVQKTRLCQLTGDLLYFGSVYEVA